MADPIALRAIYAVRTRLYGILTSGGYNTNAGERVFIGRPVTDAKADLPCIAIREGNEEATATGPKEAQVPPTGGSPKMNVTLEINVEGYCAASQTNAGIQNSLLKADIKRAMNTGSPLSESGLSIGPLQYLGSEPFEREDGADAECVRVKFAAIYTEKYGDPDAKQ